MARFNEFLATRPSANLLTNDKFVVLSNNKTTTVTLANLKTHLFANTTFSGTVTIPSSIFSGDAVMNAGSQIDFADTVEDKIYWYSNTYKTGIASSTLYQEVADGAKHEFRVSGTPYLTVSSATTTVASTALVVPTPTEAPHATTKTYVDTADALKAPLANPTFTGNVVVPNANAANEALAYEQTGARLGDLYLNSTVPIGVRKVDGTGTTFDLRRISNDETRLRVLDAAQTTYTQIIINTLTRNINFDATSVTVPAATAANHAARTTAINAATGQMQINGIEIGDTGWRTLVSWDAAGAYTYSALGTLDANFIPQAGVSGAIKVRRIGNMVSYRLYGINTNSALAADTTYTIFTPSTAISSSLRINATVPFAGRFATHGINTISSPITIRVSEGFASGAILVSSDATDSVGTPLVDTWPTTLPGTAA